MKNKFIPDDYTYLYNQIYRALKKMKPYIIEKNCGTAVYERYERRFKLAISLSDMVRKDKIRSPKTPKAIRILHKIMQLESQGWWD